jgi:Zn-dependent peptidase ImmA (M78 family)
MDSPAPLVPLFSTKDDPEDVARAIRKRTGVSLDTQLSWTSATEALRVWREAVEDCAVTVFMVSMGEESCRGFSIWDDRAPLICVNTAWLPEARVFSLFHEYAHLVSRTNSVCVEDAPLGSSAAGDPTERWCERVAAAVVIPPESLERVVAELSRGSGGWRADLGAVTRVANQLRVSRRAAALRLIEARHASWSLFKALPSHVDRRLGGGGGHGRTRATIRRQQLGSRTINLFAEALERDLLGPADVIDYLGVSPDALATEPARAEDG